MCGSLGVYKSKGIMPDSHSSNLRIWVVSDISIAIHSKFGLGAVLALDTLKTARLYFLWLEPDELMKILGQCDTTINVILV